MPPYTIHLRIHPNYKGVIDNKILRAAARAALTHQAAPTPTPSAVTIAVTTDAALRQLNRDYLGHDYATDVLSFPSDDTDPDSGARYLGDLALSWPRAQAQAQAGGHPVSAEIQLLIVHGVLHLLGHDHATAKQKQRMWAAQAEILQVLKAPITGPAKE